jgi:HK97 family phage major capsid protein
MTEKEIKKKTLELRKEVESEITDSVTKKIKKDLDFDSLVAKISEIGDQNKSLVEKLEKQNVYKIFTGFDTEKDIEEANQKDLSKAFGLALFNKDTEALAKISRKSYELLSPRMKALSEGVDADGGLLVPEQFRAELGIELDNVLQLRNYVTILQMTRKTKELPKLDSDLDVYWTSEGATKTTTSLEFARPDLTAHKIAAILYSTDELFDDSVINLQQVIMQRFARKLAEKEETALLVGTGSGQPTGLFVDSNISTTTSSSFTGISGINELKTLYYSVPVQFRARGTWIVPDSQMETIDKFVDGNNRPFMQMNPVDPTTPRIFGKEVVVVPDEYMTGKTDQIMFGDLKEAYMMGERHEMRVKITQDETTAFKQDKTAIRVVKRLGGLVFFPNAVRKLISIS